MLVIKHPDLENEANVKANASRSQYADEPNEEDAKIVLLIRERYTLSMELALHRKKLVGAVDEDEWNAYQNYVLECIERARASEAVSER